jgi:hypothetical protein
MGDKRKISKAKGVEICMELLSVGNSRKEIIQEITAKYKACERSIDNWIKEAAPGLQERQRQAEVIRARENEAAIIESAKKLNLTRERILEEYAKIAFLDIRKIFTVDGGLKPIQDIDDDTAGGLSGIESFDIKTADSDEVLGTNRKVKAWDKKAALDSICKVLGYNAPEKSEVAGTITLADLPITFK